MSLIMYNTVFLSEGKRSLLKPLLIPQQTKFLAPPPKKKKKAAGGGNVFLWIVNNALFSLQLYFNCTSTRKVESPGQICIKSISPTFTRHRLSFKILMTMKVSIRSSFQWYKRNDTLNWRFRSHHFCKSGPDRGISLKHFQFSGYCCHWKSNHAVSQQGQPNTSDHYKSVQVNKFIPPDELIY